LTIDRVMVDPLRGRCWAYGIAVQGTGPGSPEPFVTARTVVVDAAIIPLFFKKLIIEELRIDEPFAVIALKPGAMPVVPVPIPAFRLRRLQHRAQTLFETHPATAAVTHSLPTIENLLVTNGRIMFTNPSTDPPAELAWEDVTLSVPELWQSLDGRQARVRYTASARMADGPGTLDITGEFRKDHAGLHHAGSAALREFPIERLVAFNPVSLPAQTAGGMLMINAELTMSSGTLAIPLTVSCVGLEIVFKPGTRRVFGIDAGIIEALAESTGGQLTCDVAVTGTPAQPRVNTAAIMTQLVRQALTDNAAISIERKARKYGVYLERMLKKKARKR